MIVFYDNDLSEYLLRLLFIGYFFGDMKECGERMNPMFLYSPSAEIQCIPKKAAFRNDDINAKPL